MRIIVKFMKVVLLKDVKGLGQIGDIKNVAAGYAGNFLLPQKLVRLATDDSVKEVEQDRVRQAKVAEKELVDTEKLASSLNSQVVKIVGKVNESGTLYAAVTSAKIASELKQRGFDVKKNQVMLPEPIKEEGEYPVTISLDHGLEAEITVIINE
jgi:large subunit ribosomal protein L9